MQPPAEEFRRRYLENIEKLVLTQEKTISYSGVIKKKIKVEKEVADTCYMEENGNEGGLEKDKEGSDKDDEKSENGTQGSEKSEARIKKSKSKEMKSIDQNQNFSFPPLLLNGGRIFFDIEQARNVPVSENIRAMRELWSGGYSYLTFLLFFSANKLHMTV